MPFETDKKKIIELAQSWLDKADYISKGHKEMYQWAIDNEIVEPVCELATNETGCNRDGEWIIYKDVYDYSIEKYNKENGTNIERYSDGSYDRSKIESYSDEPRIGGYPSNIIRSYDEMIEFMESGHIDETGKHFPFQLDEDRRENVMNGIKKFFTNHPKGIITFG